MKKHVLIVAVALGLSMSASAQDENYLPESGDWGLGFDANPLLNYVGNLFNGTSGNSMNAQWENGNNAIFGKMFLDESTAVRAWVRLGFGSQTWRNLVVDDAALAADPASTDMVEDELKSSYNAIVIGGGIEMRRGGARLQGYYGGDLLFGIGGSKDTYTYGNDISTTTGVATTTTDFFTGANSSQGARTLSQNFGGSFMLGLRGIIGVEYFVLPKISIGAEYGWGLAFNSTGDGETVTEFFDGTGVDETTTASAGGGSFGIDTDNNGGAIRLMFHF